MIKYAILLLLSGSLLVSCGKKKTYCWKCQFAMGVQSRMLDTTVCNMTEEESKVFQQQTAQRMIDTHGKPMSAPSSWCHKSSK